MDYTGSLIF